MKNTKNEKSDTCNEGFSDDSKHGKTCIYVCPTRSIKYYYRCNPQPKGTIFKCMRVPVLVGAVSPFIICLVLSPFFSYLMPSTDLIIQVVCSSIPTYGRHVNLDIKARKTEYWLDVLPTIVHVYDMWQQMTTCRKVDRRVGHERFQISHRLTAPF